MTEKIDVVRRLRRLGQGVEFLLQVLHRPHGRRQRPQPTGRTHGQRQAMVLRTRHRGLHDGRNQARHEIVESHTGHQVENSKSLFCMLQTHL